MKKFISLIIVSMLTFFLIKDSQAYLFWNQAGGFNGTSSYVAVPNSASLNITGSFTLEAWIMPSSIIVPSTPIILGKGTPAAYDLRLTNSGFAGRVALRTNGLTRLISTTAVQPNVWTHVAGTFNSGTNTFSIIINGSLDTSVVIAGAAPVATTDSLFIGKGFNDNFLGQIDEVRVWDGIVFPNEISRNRKTSIGTSSGIYDELVMSITFQERESLGIDFGLTDWSGNGNSGFNRNVTAVNLSNRPSNTIMHNESVNLDGAGDYLAGDDNAGNSPDNELTMEAWIFPRTLDVDNIIIHKGSPDGFSTDYALRIFNGNLNAVINSKGTYISDAVVPLNQWSHVAFTLDGPNGIYKFYLNGKLVTTGINDKGFIFDNTDSLYIGGTNILTCFDGYIDEVRIHLGVQSDAEIQNMIFTSVDEVNNPFTGCYYNLDGYLVSNAGTTSRLFFRNGAKFSHPGMLANSPVSPVNRSDDHGFQNGFLLKSSDRRIPQTGTSGSMLVDSINVSSSQTISDLNVFVALNHTDESELSLTLMSPTGTTVALYSNNTLLGAADNIVSIFDQEADSSVINNSYTAFSPSAKLTGNMLALNGQNTNGIWKLFIIDNAAGDTGRLYGWGLRFNNAKQKQNALSFKSIIQGFYDPATDLMVRDTMSVFLRYMTSPFSIVDSAKVYLQTDGTGTALFPNAEKSTNYYIQTRHRNSINIWSNFPVSFDGFTAEAYYDFTDDLTKAFGDNMIEVDAAPLVFAQYNGDVNRDAFINLSDIIEVNNASSAFTSGYVRTDVTGDNIVNLFDMVLVFNNSAGFVQEIAP